MPCYSPLLAWRGGVLKSGKCEMLFKRPVVETASLYQLKLPCGQCIGCRLERSRQWAIRCLHEASLYDRNSFITLTYDNDHLPLGGGLEMRDFQLFMKRLRKFADLPGPGIRYFHCGEYGEVCKICKLSKKFCRCRRFIPTIGRPHFHAIIFNYDFSDKYFLKKSDRGDVYWRSPALEKLWDLGQSMIGSVTFESAAYVARYVMKKITGKNADDHYLNRDTGEVRKPEYITMSRRSGIGKEYFNKYKLDMFPQDYAILRGMKLRPPKYYDGLYEISNPMDFFMLKAKRIKAACKADPTGFGESGDSRLRDKEIVKRAQIGSLSRNLEV